MNAGVSHVEKETAEVWSVVGIWTLQPMSNSSIAVNVFLEFFSTAGEHRRELVQDSYKFSTEVYNAKAERDTKQCKYGAGCWYPSDGTADVAGQREF